MSGCIGQRRIIGLQRPGAGHVYNLKTRKLLKQLLETLERVGCQFQFCRGPNVRPEHMITCHVCWTIRDVRAALGRPRAET